MMHIFRYNTQISYSYMITDWSKLMTDIPHQAAILYQLGSRCHGVKHVSM